MQIRKLTLTAEKKFQLILLKIILKMCFFFHYIGANSYLFVNATEIIKFKVVATPLCLGNISKDFSVNNMKKTGLQGYVYDFSVDCDAISMIIMIKKCMQFLCNIYCIVCPFFFNNH